MKTPDELLALAKREPPAVRRLTPPGNYACFEKVLEELHIVKKHSVPHIVSKLVKWGGIEAAAANRTRHGLYRILRRWKRESKLENTNA